MDGEGVDVQPRDIATVEWMAEWWVMTSAQVHRWWSMPAQIGIHPTGRVPGAQRVRTRLRLLAAGGYLTWSKLPTSDAKLWTVTKEGMEVSQLGWHAPRAMRHSQFVHEHSLANLAMDLLEDGWEVVTERRMRQEDQLGVGDWSVVLPTQAAATTHYPDLWVRRHAGDPWRAVEVELTPKTGPRLQQILAAFTERGVGVSYYTHRPVVAKAVKVAASRVQCTDLEVLAFDVSTAPAEAGAPPRVADPSLPVEAGPAREVPA